MNSNLDDKPPGNKYDLPSHVGIIYSDVKREYFPTESQYLTEKDALRDAQVVASYLEKIGIETSLYAANSELGEKLKIHRPDMVLNLVGSVRGLEYLASAIPATLELLEIPYTGADMLGESLSYSKFLVNTLLKQNGVPVPNYQLFNTSLDALDTTLRFPLISKLNEIHGAVEITQDAVSENEKHLRERLKFLINTYHQAVLVEEYIVGSEITAFILEGLNKKVYLAERIFNKPHGKYIFADFETQWIGTDENAVEYKRYDDPVLKEYVKKAFDITKMSDYGKFDVRVDSSGRYFFLDSNSNPSFGPKEISTPMAYVLELYGVSFVDILKRLLMNTIRDSNSKLLPIPNGD